MLMETYGVRKRESGLVRGGGGNGAAGRSSKPDEMTTKMLVAASDKLWQSVLHGSAPWVISHPIEFQVSGSLPPLRRVCVSSDV